MTSMISHDTNIRVSSVLNRDVKQFGKSFLTDNKEETCWNSDQGSPQFILIDFPHFVVLEELWLKFQGGFVGQNCSLESADEDGKGVNWEHVMAFHPQDINALQKFPISSTKAIRRLKITFDSSTDFYGRITIYKLDIMGHKADVDESLKDHAL